MGNQFSDQNEAFNKLVEAGSLLFYDMTSVTSCSKNLKLAEKGYNADHEYENQVTVIMAFSIKSWVPMTVNIFYALVKDIKPIGYLIDAFIIGIWAS